MVRPIHLGDKSWLSYLMLYLTLKNKGTTLAFSENAERAGIASRAGQTDLQEIDAVLLEKNKIKIIEAKGVERSRYSTIRRKQVTQYLKIADRLNINCEVWGFVRFKAFGYIVGVKLKEPKTTQIFICQFTGIPKYECCVLGRAEAVQKPDLVIKEKEMISYIQERCTNANNNKHIGESQVLP